MSPDETRIAELESEVESLKGQLEETTEDRDRLWRVIDEIDTIARREA